MWKFTFPIIFLAATSCVSSKVGEWSKKDRRKADKAVNESYQELVGIFGEAKAIEFIECYIDKIENTYSSYQEADEDYEGCSLLAKACAETLEH